MQETVSSRSAELDHLVRLRVGVNTGEVLVGALQAGGDYTAMGDVVNTAARLQTAAEPGEVLVGPTTWNATRRAIGYEARGMLSAKNREALIETYVATAPLTAPGGRPDRPEVPIVGRASELALLAQAADSALRQQRAAFVLIVGDAGMGKSRLAEEVTQGVAARHGAVAFHGRCVPYGEANVWWPVAEALRGGAGITSSDDPRAVREKLGALVAERIGVPAGDPEAARLVHGLGRFLGIDGSAKESDPSRGTDEAVGALLAYLEAMTDRQPVVVQMSDLHWADDAVLDAGAQLLERLSRRPFTLVTTARRSLLDRWRPPAGRFDTYVLNLEPLDRDAASFLLHSLVGESALLTPEVEAALLDRAGGNPFFLEELVALLKERGGAPVVASPYGGPLAELPDTLRGLLTARLDRLDPLARSLLEDAAVLGRRGRVEWLRVMSSAVRGTSEIEASLDDLVRRDLLVVDGGTWSFRSDLLREVAYHTLPKLDRARRHLGIAAFMEKKHEGEWTDAQVDQLAWHYGLAAELANDLGGLEEFTEDTTERALHWLEQASARAERLRTLPVAARLYDEALTLVGSDDERRFRLLVGRARVAAERRDLDQARSDVAAARRLAEAAGNTDGEAAALLVEGDIEYKAGNVDASVALLDRAVARFEAAGEAHGRADALRTRALAELFGARYDGAERSALAALEAYISLGDSRSTAWSCQVLAWIMFITGRVAEAESWLDQALSTFRELNDTAGEAWAEGLLAWVRFQEGCSAEALELQAKVLREARVGGDRWVSGMMLMLGGLLSLWLGDTEAAIKQASEARALFADLNDRFGLIRAACGQGRALVMAGRVSEGLEVLDEARRRSEAVGNAEDRQLALVATAGTLVQLGDPSAALDVLAADSPDPSEAEGSIMEIDRLVIGGLAALQLGELEAGGEQLARAAELHDSLICANAGQVILTDAYVSSAHALGLACTGKPGDADTLARQAIESERGTYLDRMTARLASAIAAFRSGDLDAACRVLDGTFAEVDATADKLSQAVLRLLAARVRELAGLPDAGAAAREASVALDSLGIEATGWRRLFDVALSGVASLRVPG